MKLSDKIESYEDYLKVTGPGGERMVDYRAGNGRLGLWRTLMAPTTGPNRALQPLINVSNVPPSHWWMHREDARQTLGIYDAPTSVIAEMHQSAVFSHYYVHVSTRDPTQIAYTPSHADGCVDRQVHMALGRFLRKYCLSLTDTEIAALEARHRSELTPDVRLHNFIDEWDTCLAVYKHISSCMGKDEGNFHSDIHPVAMYKAPGYHLATLYNADGKASARCIVYVNPKDESDKRWVRVYGDVVLGTWLKKNGFQAKSLEGTYLYTHKLPRGIGNGFDEKARILMAYLDPGSDREGRFQNGPTIWDGGNKLYVLPKAYDAARYPKAFVPQSTSGYLDVWATPVNVKSIVSGEDFNAIDTPFKHVWINGTRGYAKFEETLDFLDIYVTRKEHFLVPRDTPMFRHGGHFWLETPDMREMLDFYKLNVEFYPQEQDWFHPDTRGSNHVRTVNGWIKKDDVVYLISGGSKMQMHMSRLTGTEERVASIDEIKTFALAGTRIERTTANRKVVPGVHPVVQVASGEWMYERHARHVDVFGIVVWVPMDAADDYIKQIGLPKEIKDNIAQMVAVQKRNDVVVRKVIYTYMMNRGDVFVPLSHDKTTGTFEWSYIWAAGEVAVEPIRSFLKAESPKNVGAAQAAANKFKNLASLLIAEVDARWAEKTAAEAPTPAAVAV